jgi:hypothetical protein
MRRFFRTGVLFVIVTVSLLSGLPLFGETVPPFVMPSARMAALGGSHAAMGDDFYTLFTNPAGFVGIEKEFSAAELSLSLYGPVFEMLDLVMNDTSGSIDISGIISDRGFAMGADLGGPVALGWVGKGLGLGLFSRGTVKASVTGTQIRPIASGEIFMVGGYAVRVVDKESHILDVGFLGKGFFRSGLELGASILDIATMFDDIGKKPFKTVLGLGFDLGVRYSFAETFSAALVCMDTYSPVLITTYSSYDAFQDKSTPAPAGEYGAIDPRLNLGVKYRIRSNFLDRYISNFSVMADYHDFLNLTAIIPRHPILNIGIGTELTVLDKLSFRFGLADALPALGFGLDLSFMKLDFAIYGKELGLDPGVFPTYAVDIGLLFRY